MGKIHSFKNWLDEQAAPYVYDGGETHLDPQVTPNPQRMQMPTTNTGGQDKTQQDPSLSGSSTPDPEMVQAATSLKDMQKQLSAIFQKASQKVGLFRHPQMKSSFQKNLRAGWDDIGRTHAILEPIAQGIS